MNAKAKKGLGLIGFVFIIVVALSFSLVPTFAQDPIPTQEGPGIAGSESFYGVTEPVTIQQAVPESGGGGADWVFLTSAANEQACQKAFAFAYLPTVETTETQIAQWPHCGELRVSGTGEFTVSLWANTDSNLYHSVYGPDESLAWLIVGVNGTVETSGVEVPLSEKPTRLEFEMGTSYQLNVNVGSVITETPTEGFFSVQLVRASLELVQGVVEQVAPTNPWMRLVSVGDVNCAWAAQFQVIAQPGVIYWFDQCWRLNAIGTGVLTFVTQPDSPQNYAVSDLNGLGLAYWPSGANGTYRVAKNGNWSPSVSLSTGPEGVDFPPNSGIISIEITLDGGVLIMPLGENVPGIVPQF